MWSTVTPLPTGSRNFVWDYTTQHFTNQLLMLVVMCVCVPVHVFVYVCVCVCVCVCVLYLGKSCFVHRAILEFWAYKFVILSHLIKFNHRKLFQVLMKQQLHLKREPSQKTSFSNISLSNIRLQYKLHGFSFHFYTISLSCWKHVKHKTGSGAPVGLWWRELAVILHTDMLACVHAHAHTHTHRNFNTQSTQIAFKERPLRIRKL